MPVMSMTGFARVDGHDDAANWYWELRSVNGRGLDVRLRLPPGQDRLEGPVRERVGHALTRGNVTVQLFQRRSGAGSQLVVNEAALERVLTLAAGLRARLDSPPPTVEGLLGLKGVLDVEETEEDETVIAARQQMQLDALERALDELVEARTGEGARLKTVIEEQFARIAAIVEAVATSPARTPEAIAARLDEQIKRLLESPATSLDPVRLHQEAVIMAGKADIEEELQRLRAHIAAGRDLLGGGGAIGRRLDFLTQEFNREANTLCSKSNATDVTRLGLELKAVIEQMREQVQNIE